jgi:hypothetical protein
MPTHCARLRSQQLQLLWLHGGLQPRCPMTFPPRHAGTWRIMGSDSVELLTSSFLLPISLGRLEQDQWWSLAGTICSTAPHVAPSKATHSPRGLTVARHFSYDSQDLTTLSSSPDANRGNQSWTGWAGREFLSRLGKSRYPPIGSRGFADPKKFRLVSFRPAGKKAHRVCRKLVSGLEGA